MKKPKNYDLKKDLCQDAIVGLKVYYYQTGTDTADTDLEVEFWNGKKIRDKASKIRPLIQFDISWGSIASVNHQTKKEVRGWKEYAAKESDEIKEYERLKKKFGY